MALKFRSCACSWLALTAPSFIALSTPASAQEVGPEATRAPQTSGAVEAGIGDIIVTAERHEQSVQKSALTIQVLGGDDALKAGLSSAAEIGKLTTGVEIGVGGGNAQIYIRGVGSYAYTAITSPGVAFNVDGVYIGRPDSIGGNFYDIARIEVLKGPQGTLYGRNANGGSINLITNAPKLGARTLDLNLEAGNYGMIHASGAVNLPLGENAAVRAAFNIMNRDGYLSNGNFDDVQQSGRIRFKWEPNSDVSVLLNADYAHIGGKGSNSVWLPRRPGSSAYEATSEPAALAYKHSFPALVPFAPFTISEGDDAFQDSNFYNISAQLDWHLGFASLTVLPAYRRSEVRYRSYDPTALFEPVSNTNQTSLEVRLGNSSSALTWVVGGYYFQEETDAEITFVAGDIPVPFLGNHPLQNLFFIQNPSTKAYAAFGQATVELTDGLRLIAGGRYTYEKAALNGSTFERSPFALKTGSPYQNRKNFDGFTYKVGAEYDVGPRNMLYVTYSTGFKAGGFNQTDTIPENAFDPEKLNSLEIGSKNRFFHNKLQINLSAFHWKYKKLQDSRVGFDGRGELNFLTFNSGDAKIYGGTLDIIAQPTEDDSFTFSGEYAHSEYQDFIINTPAFAFLPGSNGCVITPNGSFIRQDCSGFQVARVPKLSMRASYDHIFRLPDGGGITAGASVKYTGARWLSIDFIPAERDGDYWVVDANLTYNSPDNKWSVGLFGRNLTKEVYYTGGIQTGFIAGLFAANIGAPRTYGVRASFKFGD